jgi:hypothetical protein
VRPLWIFSTSVLAALSLVGLIAPAGCSSPSSESSAGTTTAGGCTTYVSTGDLSKSVSFASDVMPIFQASCATGGTSCHAAGPNPTPMALFLGGGAESAKAIHDRIVGQPSGENPAMNLVTAGDPAHSFLMHKMDNDQCTLASQCAAGTYANVYKNCGAVMPQPVPPATTSDALPAAQRDTVRAWIMQGARND